MFDIYLIWKHISIQCIVIELHFEMQTALFRDKTWVNESTYYDDNRNAMSTSFQRRGI